MSNPDPNNPSLPPTNPTAPVDDLLPPLPPIDLPVVTPTVPSEPVAVPENLPEELEKKLGYEETPAAPPPPVPQKKLGRAFQIGAGVAVLVAVIGGGLVAMNFLRPGETTELRSSARSSCSIVDTDQGPGCWCQSGGWQFHCAAGGKRGDAADSSCRNRCDQANQGDDSVPKTCNDNGVCDFDENGRSCPGDCRDDKSGDEDGDGKGDKGGGSGGTGGILSCTSDSQCKSGATCQNNKCVTRAPQAANGGCGCPIGFLCGNFDGNTYACFQIDTDETVVSGGQGDSCIAGQRTACGADGCGTGEQRICFGGTFSEFGACVKSDACAPEVAEGGSCEGMKQQSSGEPSHGAFVGCSGYKNCFCDDLVGPGGLSGKVRCYEDSQNDSCGAPGKPKPKQPTTPGKPEQPGENPPPGLPPAPSEPPVKPPSGLVCTGLNSSKAAPVVGDTITLTCSSKGTNKVDHFEFRYRVGSGGWINLGSGTAQGSNKKYSGTSQLTVSQSGSHQVQCRVCKKADGNCTNWGKKS